MDSKSGSESSGTFTWGVIAGLLVLVGAGGAYLSGVFNGVQDATPVQPEVVAVPEDDAQASAPAPAADEETPAQETTDAATVVAPELDQIFVEPDGNTVLSGNAEPGSKVHVLLDGESIHSFSVDNTGQFAEFVSIPFSDSARGLTLETDGGDTPLRSDDYVIAALPEPEPPEDVASAEVSVDADGPAPDAGAEQAASGQETAAAGAASQQVSVLRSGEDGVELIQSPNAQADQVALDTIGYSDTGDVKLTGRVPDGSIVRLYLNNRLVADLPATDDGKWRSELQGVDPGVYTLRVDEVSADGTVVSRLETPLKREPIESLQAETVPVEAAQDDEASPVIASVTVQEGDTLWAISRERFGDGMLFVRLFEANKGAIRDPDLIYPGQVFTIPQ